MAGENVDERDIRVLEMGRIIVLRAPNPISLCKNGFERKWGWWLLVKPYGVVDGKGQKWGKSLWMRAWRFGISLGDADGVFRTPHIGLTKL